MTNTTLMLLRQLKLTGMADALTMQQSQPNNYDNLSFEERLQLLVDAEHLGPAGAFEREPTVLNPVTTSKP